MLCIVIRFYFSANNLYLYNYVKVNQVIIPEPLKTLLVKALSSC
jgi:hypothetical protein